MLVVVVPPALRGWTDSGTSTGTDCAVPFPANGRENTDKPAPTCRRYADGIPRCRVHSLSYRIPFPARPASLRGDTCSKAAPSSIPFSTMPGRKRTHILFIIDSWKSASSRTPRFSLPPEANPAHPDGQSRRCTARGRPPLQRYKHRQRIGTCHRTPPLNTACHVAQRHLSRACARA